MAVTKILVPVDGSTHSLKAFRIALDNAKNSNAKISVLTCLEKDDVGPLITTIELATKVKCDDLSQEKFNELASAAKEKCPISRLFAGAEIKLNAELL